MRATAASLIVFSVYLGLMGVGLILDPETLMELVGIQHEGTFWMFRLIGILAIILGVYYLVAVQFDLQPLYGWTVKMRYFAALGMASFWLAGEVEASILQFAAMDFLGASWTWWAMRRQES